MRNAAPVLILLFLLTHDPSWGSSFFDGLERTVVLRQPERLEEYREVLRREIDLLGGRTWGAGDLRAYTLAYVNTRLSPILPASEKAERARLLAEAEAALRQTLQANPQDAEAHALLGAVYGAQISLAPWKALTLGPRVASAFATAEKLAPGNPRVSLQKGISLLFVPRVFGGGAEASLRELRRAETLFAREPAGKSWPNWGRLDVLAWLGRALAEKGDRQAARAAYERALALEPDSVWVRRILIPELER